LFATVNFTEITEKYTRNQHSKTAIPFNKYCQLEPFYQHPVSSMVDNSQSMRAAHVRGKQPLQQSVRHKNTAKQ